MDWFARLKIANKLSVMVTSVILVFSFLSGMILWTSLSDVMQQDLRERGLSLAAEVAQLSSEPIQTANIFALEELVYMAKKNNNFVEYVFIVDKNNRIMADTFENGIPQGLLLIHKVTENVMTTPSIITLTSDKGVIQDILYPIEDGALGYVRIGISERTINMLLANNFLKLVGITAFVGLLGALFVFKLTNIFTRPLKKLMQRAECISNGHLPEKSLRVRSDDEIGRLTAAMNTMAQHLSEGEQERKRLLQHLLNAQENERKNISMELHDESGQALTALLLSIRTLANQTDDPESKAYIMEVRDEAAHVLQKLRNLAVELRPPALDELGIEAAVQNLISQYQKYHALSVDLQCRLQGPLDDLTNLATYRIIQECLTNIVKHSQADQACIILHEEQGELHLIIKDNGIGITEADIKRARQTNHLGIYGIQERVRLLGGTIKISALPQWPTVYEIIFAIDEVK